MTMRHVVSCVTQTTFVFSAWNTPCSMASHLISLWMNNWLDMIHCDSLMYTQNCVEFAFGLGMIIINAQYLFQVFGFPTIHARIPSFLVDYLVEWQIPNKQTHKRKHFAWVARLITAYDNNFKFRKVKASPIFIVLTLRLCNAEIRYE